MKTGLGKIALDAKLVWFTQSQRRGDRDESQRIETRCLCLLGRIAPARVLPSPKTFSKLYFPAVSRSL